VSTNHDGYEKAMEDVFSILDAHRSLAGASRPAVSTAHADTLEAIRIAFETLRTNNIVCSRIDRDNRCESDIHYGFESRSYRCNKKRGHGGEHSATVEWQDGVFGTSSGEEERHG
jgi:hypothetical protein